MKPEMLAKVRPMSGDVTAKGLGMVHEDLRRVVETSEIVFHLAASLKEEAPLSHNILHNLVGTQNMLEVARCMNKLVHMQHVSTAFCITEPEEVLEKVYDFVRNPDDLLLMSQWLQDATFEAIEKEVLGSFPNTYLYSKRLAETLVQREFPNLPIAIVRPSIILPTLSEPFPGWIDSLHGYPGLLHAAGSGLLRSMFCDDESPTEYIPVDLAVNGMILMAKRLSLMPRQSEIPVMTVTCDHCQKHRIGSLLRMVKNAGQKYPLPWSLW